MERVQRAHTCLPLPTAVPGNRSSFRGSVASGPQPAWKALLPSQADTAAPPNLSQADSQVSPVTSAS